MRTSARRNPGDTKHSRGALVKYKRKQLLAAVVSVPLLLAVLAFIFWIERTEARATAAVAALRKSLTHQQSHEAIEKRNAQAKAIKSSSASLEASVSPSEVVEDYTEWEEFVANLDIHSPLESHQHERLKQLIAKQQVLLLRIHGLAAANKPWYTLDLSEGIEIRLDHLRQMRNYTRLLRAEMALALNAGETAKVLRALTSIFKLSSVLQEEPLLISQLARIGNNGIGIDALGSIPAGTFSADEVRELQALLAAHDYRRSISNSLSMEAALGIGIFESVRTGGKSSVDFMEPFWPGGIVMDIYTSPIGRPFVSLDEAAYVQAMERIGSILLQPYFEAQGELGAWDRDVRAFPIWRPISRTVLPAMTRVSRSVARAEAFSNLAFLGLAIEQYHAEHGEYPSSLATVGTADSITDPFTGRPYRYQVFRDTFQLYSLGENLQDDTGQHSIQEGDIVWRGFEKRGQQSL